MPFIIENFEYVVTSVLIIILVVLVIVFRYNVYLSKFFSNKKFKVNSKYEFEPLTGNKFFSLNIFNNNVNDTRIIGFGYIYKNHNIDYYKTYLKNNDLPEITKVNIPSRDCINSKINAFNLKTIISDMNKGKRRVTNLKSFVSDSQGLTYKSSTKMVAKQLTYLLKLDYIESHAKKKEIRKKMRLEKQAVARQIRIDKHLKRKEKLDKLKLKIKSILPKRKSK
ncbi:hypothetical protein RJI07_04010 [Mycoplasmatota bacterium WC30]